MIAHDGVDDEGKPGSDHREGQGREGGGQGIAEEPGEDGPQHHNADQGDHGHIFYVARAAQAAGIDHAAVLRQHADNDHIEGKGDGADDLLIRGEQQRQLPAQEEDDQHQPQGNINGDPAGNAHVHHGQVGILRAQALAHQRGARGGNAVPQGKGQGSHLVHDLVGGEGVGADAGHQPRGDQKAHAQASGFQHGAGAHPGKPLQGDPVKLRQAQVVIAVFPADEAHGDAAGNNGAANGGDGRAAHAHPGKAQLAVDQHIVEAYVDQVGGDIGDHGDAGFADGAHGGADAQRPAVEHQPQGNNAEISHAHFHGVLVGSGQAHEPVCAEKAQQGHDDAQHGDQGQGPFITLFL